ncbi:Acyl transferase domain-containing protein [Thermomonospora echinospora]|uniref:Acyl transferase domain-containing protein n=2 Tax=Thermomonospora echinospora TaxID=1992 RepID=A0A1H5XN11_9ACTN|nr:Acyl transferase domain-containing protein [Thermomonospora echinospora]
MTPFGLPAARLAVAVARAGALGALDLGRDRDAALAALEQVGRWWDGPFAVRIPPGCPVRPEELPEAAGTLLVDAPALEAARPYMPGRRLLVEVVDPDEAHAAVRLGADGLIARGCEAGGRIGELTTFVLLQRLLGDPGLSHPVWAAGGIGPHTAAAAVAGGAAGVLLDAQLALVRELDLPDEVAAAIGAMDGGETRVVAGHRVYTRPDLPAFDTDDPAEVRARLGALDLRGRLLPIGQEGAFARPLAERYKTAGGVVQAVAGQIGRNVAAAVRAEPLARPGGPAGGPVFQGPMTRVSDRAAFAEAVAQDGGVPFLALALMAGEETRRLLAETAERLGDRPWGVGVLGFAPPEIRAAQLAAVRAARPPYALIAGGRPAQAAPLEDAGIAVYLHVPSPGLLERFLAEGARRFVFEGRECGGHVGPRAAFPLWEAQVQRLLAFTDEHPDAAADLSVAFAGGIHDERSAAMVAALAGPLAERGAEIRVLMGTAYLFTQEAVVAGAIVPGFQRAAVACERTVLLETSPGHATRCALTPYAEAFEQARRDLSDSGMSRQEMWARLERLNLGRLRLASRGLRREGDRLLESGQDEQYREGMFMIGQVAGLRSDVTTIAALHEQVGAGATRFLADRARELGLGEAAEPRPRPLDVAIVGIGCAFPGARDAAEYWANVVGGVDAVTEVPAERWDSGLYWDPAGPPGEKTPSKWGGFLPGIPFDALAHGIPPNSLGSVDPVQLLALEIAARALADAGYADRPFDRSRTAVIFGAEGGTDLGTAYGARALLPGYYGEVPPGLDERLPRLTEDSFPGVLSNVIAGRIANRLDLGGANYTVNAACAASLAALDAACKELACGSADMVLCGGADLHNGVYDYLLFASARALSPSGRCAPFDAGADGIALGEGVACVVLKRLADAERDGDRIYAVIKAVAGASDGRSRGLTAPRPEGQRLVLERAYRAAGIRPSQVGLVEAHGTGTAVGDRTELATLTETFAGTAPGRVVLGSVKSQIGHTKCAAGLAGLIKAAYAVHTGVRPGTLHLREPTPAWDRRTSPFAFGHAPRPWAADPAGRYAGVSGFGFGGTNFHAVLAGYGGAPEPVSGVAEWPAELFLIRGADRAEARERLDRLAAHGTDARLRDLARTAAAWDQGPVQIALVATGPQDLAAKIEQARRFRAAPGVFPAGSGERGQVAFLFPGQGSQRPGMLADLFVAFPRLQRLLRLGDERYAEAMFPPAAFTAEDRGRQRAALTDTRIAQPALGIAGLAVHRLLTELGVHPDMAAGHSYGELVALCAAGVFGEDDLIGLSAARAEAILSSVRDSGDGDPGTMAAVAATVDEVRAVIGGLPRVVVANHNAPRQVVISGPTAAVEEAVRALAAEGLAAERIPVACAFHSPLAGGAATGLSVELAGRRLHSPAFPVWSNATAAPYHTAPELLAATLAEQVAAPVRFVEQIEAMYAAGARVFVEAGPGRVLTRLVGRILADRPHTVVACDRPADGAGRGLAGLHGLLLALAELAAAGVEVNPLPLFAGRDANVLPAEPPARPGWVVDGHLVRTADGGHPVNGLRPAERIAAPALRPPDRDTAVLEYLRMSRELAAAQRDVVLGYLGAPVPPPRKDPVPATAPSPHVPPPRPVPQGDDPGTEGGVPGPRRAEAPAESLREQVLAVISARTGYPEDMLATGLDLEADLSIDSIKRTEIIGDLADQVGLAAPGGGPGEPVVERLSRIRTIDEMVTWLGGHLREGGDRGENGGRGKGGTAPRPAPAAPAAVPPRRHVVRPAELPALAAPPPGPGPLTGRRCLVVDDGRGVAPELAALLDRHGAHVRVAPEVDGRADAVIHLAALRPSGPPVLPGVYGGIRDALLGGTGRLLLVTGTGGTFGHDGSPDAVTGAGLRGLARTLALEYPEALVRAVDLNTGDDPWALAERLVAELLGEPGPVVVGYEGDARRTLALVPEELAGEASLPLDRDGVVLLTGGARGITARVSCALAAATGCHIEIIGRTPVPEHAEDPALATAVDETALRRVLARQGGRAPAEIEAAVRRVLAGREVRATLAALDGAAASVRYHALDVCDPQAVRAAVEDVYARHGRLDGVVHGAGVLEDRLVRDKDLASFARVYETKAGAARTLADAVRPDLGFFVVFGSVAGTLGNRGQADYAAANDACATLAHVWRTRLHGRVLVADWGPWAGGGMVTPELAREYARRGTALLDPDAAVRALLREIAGGTEPQVVLTGDTP